MPKSVGEMLVVFEPDTGSKSHPSRPTRRLHIGSCREQAISLKSLRTFRARKKDPQVAIANKRLAGNVPVGTLCWRPNCVGRLATATLCVFRATANGVSAIARPAPVLRGFGRVESSQKSPVGGSRSEERRVGKEC